MKQYEYSEDTKSDLIKDVISALGEFVGTTFFVFMGISSVNSAYESMYARNVNDIKNIEKVTNYTYVPAVNEDASNSGLDPASQIQVACGFGFGLMCMVWAFFRISGGHLNPAVTLGLFCSGAVPPVKAVLYIIGQCCGAMLGSLFSKALFPTPSTGTFRGANGIGGSVAAGFFLELILTFLLVFVVHMLALEVNNARNVAPFVIGTIVFVGHLIAIPITGTSMNPARSFGASVVSGDWDDHWVFWVAPLCGGILASVFYRLFSFFNIQALNGNQDHTTAMEYENKAIAINSTESLPH
jgi:MIP family channel proteins